MGWVCSEMTSAVSDNSQTVLYEQSHHQNLQLRVQPFCQSDACRYEQTRGTDVS